MARDDYYVIVYNILAYLYVQLKNGDKVDPEMLKASSKYLDINESYWLYILEHLIDDGYIERAYIKKGWGNTLLDVDLSECRITPAGIDYLCNNNLMEKAKEFLKDVKAIVPFI